jgi:hypothetical protein
MTVNQKLYFTVTEGQGIEMFNSFKHHQKALKGLSAPQNPTTPSPYTGYEEVFVGTLRASGYITASGTGITYVDSASKVIEDENLAKLKFIPAGMGHGIQISYVGSSAPTLIPTWEYDESTGVFTIKCDANATIYVTEEWNAQGF